MPVIINASDKARDFLVSKGLIAPDKSEFVITYTYGRQVVVNDLLIEFAEMHSVMMRPTNQWRLND